VIVEGRDVDAPLTADVAVVGAGPAGIVTALELGNAGFDVLLIESGHDHTSADIQALGDAAELDPDRHAPMSLTTRRAIGGASAIWGGRCVPYDPVDFDRRGWVTDHDWPVSYHELAPYFERACEWFRCGRAVFDATDTDFLPPSLVPGLPNEEVRTSALERWSLPTHFGREYGGRLRRSARVRVVTGLTCTGIVTRSGGSGVDHLACRAIEGTEVEVRARRYVIACGGLESTRLLLASHGRDGRAIGNHSDHLGRWYMGHVEGVIARVQLTTPPRKTIYGYERDVDGVYVRRRFSLSRELQHSESLPNVIGWLAHPDLADARHRSGILSFAYLSLVSPLGGRLAPEALRLALTGVQRIPGAPYGSGEQAPLRRHLRNVARDALPTARFVADFGTKRFLVKGRRVPGFAVYNRENVYPLHYHGEHLPHRESHVTLADDRDALGMPRLRIDLRFAEADVDGVVRAHRFWDEHLRRHGVGRLEYLTTDRAEGVRQSLGGGFHQTGTTRLSTRSEDGVLDTELAVHGLPTVHVVSSSAFPTSSQANSTFMIVPFALRLVDHLKKTL
jgi:choline dehydrogenase-like flavoprotein